MLDVLVAGAGPAGLASALCASHAGLAVAVVEPRQPPIDKACGEGLMPAAVAQLRRLGVDLDGQAFRGIRYTDGTSTVDAAFRGGYGLGVRRTALQTALRTAVAARGIEVQLGRIEAITQDDRSVRVGGRTARYLIAADGLHSPIRRELNLDEPARSRHRPRWGLRRHFEVAPWSDLVEVHWSARSEAYVTPVGPNLVGVALLSSERGAFAEQLLAFPRLLERLPETGSTASRGAGPLRQRSRQRVAGRVLLVGDAAGSVDALTGEGIAVALSCARALVECIAADRPQCYERQWIRLSRRYRLITESLLWARGRPQLAGLIVPTAARAPRLFEAAVHQLAR